MNRVVGEMGVGRWADLGAVQLGVESLEMKGFLEGGGEGGGGLRGEVVWGMVTPRTPPAALMRMLWEVCSISEATVVGEPR